MEPKYFPLINQVLSSYSNIKLDNTLLLGCQHLLPSVQLLINSLFQKGLKPENTFLIGKCYSSSLATISALRQQGIFVDPQSILFNSHQSYQDDFQKYIESFLLSQTKNKNLSTYDNIIILDDGGELHLAVHKLLNNFINVIGIEQTSRGAYQLNKANLKYPIINVARSKVKLIHESPMVAEAIKIGLEKALNEIQYKPKHALIIGNGSIGQAVGTLLKERFEVTLFDLNTNKSSISEIDLERISGQIDLIIGCTGTNILPFIQRIHSLKNNVILASTSSSDIEFDAQYFRKQSIITDNCHTHINANGVYLLNCGFPVNFCGGDKDQVSLVKFQLTTALLLAGIFHGATQSEQNRNQLIDLDDNLQLFVYRKFKEESAMVTMRKADLLAVSN